MTPMCESMPTIDVLMVTYNRPAYTERVWHNGTDESTLRVVRSMQAHPRFHQLHHSDENRKLRPAINWVFERADGELLALINDDCLVADGWDHALAAAHAVEERFGVLACWHFPREDFDDTLASPKIRAFSGGQRLMMNPWVQGSGVMLKRECVDALGPLEPHETGFTPYCKRAALAGWINGWVLPLVLIDHMDDPRSPNTGLKSDADLRACVPLSARDRGVKTIGQWTAHLRKSARAIQTSPTDPRDYVGWRKKLRRIRTRLLRQELMY